jgi:hypothetical protein
VNLTKWLDAAAESAREIAAGPLGFARTTWGESARTLPDDLYGVYVPLLTETMALQLGILAGRDVCAKLARSLVGAEATEPLETDEDVLDAVGEVTNLVAGGVKVRLASECNINVGVPLALKGRVIPSHGSQSVHRLMQLDDSDVWLVMTGTRLG